MMLTALCELTGKTNLATNCLIVLYGWQNKICRVINLNISLNSIHSHISVDYLPCMYIVII